MVTGRTDADIKLEVTESLYWDTRVDAARIAVVVVDGHVTLSGTVATYRAWRAAREDALVIRGVKRVDNRVEVAVSTELERPTDAELSEAITEVLTSDPDLKAAQLQVAVTEGRVTLGGSVPSYWDQQLARVVTSTLPGVRGLTSEIVVVPTRDHQDATIAEDVLDALRRNRHVDLSQLDVAVAHGDVTLSGEVATGSIHTQVLDAARYTDGVTAITDKLHIQQPPPTSQ